MSLSVFQFGLLAASFVVLAGGAIFAVIASRLAAAGRAAQAEADIRLAATHELATEVRRLTEKFEHALAARDAAIENAFLRHNEACMASVQSSLAGHAGSGGGRSDPAGASLSGGHHGDGDGHMKDHSSTALSGPHHDDDDDNDHGKHHRAIGMSDPHHSDGVPENHHAANDEPGRTSFFARLFRR